MKDLDQKTTIAFSKALSEQRANAGISQKKLANKTGLDRTFISLLERGLRGPSLSTAILLAKGLDIKPSKFISDVQSRVNEEN